MRVEIYQDAKLIGRSEIKAADPPMGVAAGSFKPTPNYEPEVHAGEIEGVPTPRDLAFVVQSIDHGVIDCLGVFIQDYSEGLGEKQVSVLGIPYPEFEMWFGDDPAFKAYNGRP